MSCFKILICFLLAIFHALTSFASIEHHPEDIQLSKSSFLISGENFDDLFREKKGALTLCFAEQKAALVFEVFSPVKPSEILLQMVDTNREDCCWTKSSPIVTVRNAADTLKNVYRAYNVSTTGLGKKYTQPLYTRYATWILPTQQLINALTVIEKDQMEKSSFENKIYMKRVMEKAGLQNTDKSSDLKVVATTYALPHPDRIEGRYPSLPSS